MAGFAALRDALRARGLFELEPIRYLPYVILAWGGLVVSAVLLLAAPGLWLQVLSAVGVGMAMVHIGALGHDAGHGQWVSSRRASRWLAIVHWDIGTGLSASWWRDKHTSHHRATNHREADPDCYPLLSYTRGEAAAATGFRRVVATHQAVWFVFFCAITRFYFTALSCRHLFGRPRGWRLSAVAIVAHHSAYASLFVVAAGGWRAGALWMLSYVVSGLYMGYVFAPNHIGMPLNRDAGSMGVVEQMASSRNVRTGWLGDVLWCGLNYQVEHHLFPRLPRYRLRECSRYVRRWSLENSLPYCETGPCAAWRSVLSALHNVRAERPRRTSNA